MTSTVKNIKVGNTSYPVQDTKATPFLSSTDEATLLSDGTYRGETVASGTLFAVSDGAFNKFVDIVGDATLAWSQLGTFNMTMRGIIGYANGHYLCVGTESNYHSTSTDGSTWTNLDNTFPYSCKCGAVCYGNGRWVAVNRNDANAAYSDDNGVTWTSSSTGSQQTNRWSTAQAVYVVYFKNKFVYGGSYQLPSYSLDGDTWTLCSVVTGQSWPSYRRCAGLCELNGTLYWIDFGNAYVMKSTDGITWSVTQNEIPGSGVYAVGSNGSIMVAIGSGNTYWTEDGTNWFNGSSVGLGANDGGYCIWTGSYFYAWGGTVNIFSYDGKTWYSLPALNDNKSVVWDGSKLVSINSTVSSQIVQRGVVTASHTYSLDPISYTASEVDTALGEKQNTLTAGTGITIAGTAALSSGVTIVGNPTMTSDGVASGFSDAGYYSVNNMLSSATRSFEIVTAVNMTTAATSNLGIFDSTQVSSTKVGLRITTSNNNTARLRVSTDGSTTYPVDITGTTPLTVGTKIWIKATYNSNTGYALYTSTDGSTWTTEGTSSTTTAPYANDGFYIGDNSATALSLTGSIYMLDTYTKVDDAINWRAAEVVNPVISAHTSPSIGSLDPTSSLRKSLGDRYLNTTNDTTFVCTQEYEAPSSTTHYTVNGSPTISSEYVLSNCSASNYITGSQLFNCATSYSSTWAIETEITLPSGSLSGRQHYMAIGTGDHILIQEGSYLYWSMVNWGVAFESASLRHSITAGKTYTMRMEYDGTNLNWYISDDGTIPSTPTHTYAHTGSLASGNSIYFGTRPAYPSQYAQGSINLLKTKIYAAGALYWEAVTQTGGQDAEWTELQNKLTPGTGIAIDSNNVISATGGASYDPDNQEITLG